MNAQALEQATRVIDETIRARCDGVPFVEITVTPDIDEDGEEFLWVKAIYDGDPTSIDTRKSVTMVRHIRPKLDEVDVTAFPVISYVAQSDLEGLGAQEERV